MLRGPALRSQLYREARALGVPVDRRTTIAALQAALPAARIIAAEGDAEKTRAAGAELGEIFGPQRVFVAARSDWSPRPRAPVAVLPTGAADPVAAAAEALRPVIAALPDVPHRAIFRAWFSRDAQIPGADVQRARLLVRDATSARLNRADRSPLVSPSTRPEALAGLATHFLQAVIDSDNAEDEPAKVEVYFEAVPQPLQGVDVGPMREGAGALANCFCRVLATELRGALAEGPAAPRRAAALARLDAVAAAGEGVALADVGRYETLFKTAIEVRSALSPELVLRAPEKYCAGRKKLTIYYSAHHATAAPETFPRAFVAEHAALVAPPAPKRTDEYEAWIAQSLEGALGDLGGDGPADASPAVQGPAPREWEERPQALADWARAQLAQGAAVWSLGDGVAASSAGALARDPAAAAAVRAELERLGLPCGEVPPLTAASGALASFRSSNRLVATPPPLAELLKHATCEFTPWTAPHVPRGLCELDVKRCFYAAAAPDGVGAGAEAARRWGWPTGGRFVRQAVNGQPPRDLPTGWAIIGRWRLRPHLHPAAAGLLSAHLCKPGAALATPLLAFLLAQGVFVELVVSELVHALDVAPAIVWPGATAQDKLATNSIVGGLGKRGGGSTRIVSDEQEARLLCRHFADNGKNATFTEEREGLFFVEYQQKRPRRNHAALRSFFLGYAAIGVLAKLFEAVRQGREVFKLVVDALFLSPADAAALADAGDAPGTWRAKRIVQTTPLHPAHPLKDRGEGAPPSTQPDTLPPWLRAGAVLLEGGAGAGKSSEALAALWADGRQPYGRVLFTTWTNRLCAEVAARYPDLKTSTAHSYFGISQETGEVDQRRDRPFFPIVVLDEVYCFPANTVAGVLESCRSRGQILVALGDDRQLAPVGGESPGAVLRASAYVHEVAGDKRSLNDETAELKSKIRDMDDREALKVLREICKTVAVRELYELYQDGDVVLSATRSRAARISRQLLKCSGPGRLVPYVVRGTARGGRRDVALPDGRVVRAAAGEVYEVPHAPDLPEEAPGVALAYCQTVHACQGRTVEPPRRVFLLDDADLLASWASRAVYVAATRVRTLGQLVLVK